MAALYFDATYYLHIHKHNHSLHHFNSLPNPHSIFNVFPSKQKMMEWWNFCLIMDNFCWYEERISIKSCTVQGTSTPTLQHENTPFLQEQSFTPLWFFIHLKEIDEDQKQANFFIVLFHSTPLRTRLRAQWYNADQIRLFNLILL